MASYIILGSIGAGVLGVAWRGYVLSIIWTWFIAQQFGLPPIGVAQAIGLWCVATALTHRYIPTGDRKVHEIIGDALLGPLLLLGVAWIVRGLL